MSSSFGKLEGLGVSRQAEHTQWNFGGDYESRWLYWITGKKKLPSPQKNEFL